MPQKEAITPRAWSVRVASALLSRMPDHPHGGRWGLRITSLNIVSPEGFEFVYTITGPEYGVSIFSDMVVHQPELISKPGRPLRECAVDELVGDVIVLWVEQPHGPEWFSTPDENGVRWFQIPRTGF